MKTIKELEKEIEDKWFKECNAIISKELYFRVTSEWQNGFNNRYFR